jgi:hypothetical protein
MSTRWRLLAVGSGPDPEAVPFLAQEQAAGDLGRAGGCRDREALLDDLAIAVLVWPRGIIDPKPGPEHV